MNRRTVFGCFWLLVVAPLLLAATPPAYDPTPWLADLDQAHRAIEANYANLDWQTGERGFDIDAAFDRAATRIRAAGSDADACRSIERLFERFHDGHLDINWPSSSVPGAAAAPRGVCATLGYDRKMSGTGPAKALPGYRALPSESSVLEAGIIPTAQGSVGVVRIGVFMPQGYPLLCESAVAALSIPTNKPCDDACADRILTWAYRRLTSDLANRLRAIEAAGATALLIDLTGNGGGSEWAEAAVRMVSRKPLEAAPLGFMRGPHWARQWGELAGKLRDAARAAAPEDRPRLLGWAAEAEAARAEAERICTPSSPCDRIGRAGFATGLLGTSPAGSLAGKSWASLVFSPAQYAYRDGVWSKPVIVLIDQETWSAAEEFAAELQDNHAALILGARTGGAGCGHTDGGTPVTLANSKGVLEMPDCVRFRRDGSNEVRGIIPDMLIGIRADDGDAFRARLIADALPAAVEKAGALNR